jgi:hypothetical protein
MTEKLGLVRLTFRNFKGLRDFTFKVNGANTDVYGDNATFKTTLFDGFTWLLIDKDSNNKADFNIKTTDRLGNVLSGLEHDVEAEFLLDGRRLILRKVYVEVWTRKRGAAKDTFTGHTTKHYVDGVPVDEKEYKSKINGIVSEDAFKLLTNPTFFSEQLLWKDRRKKLLEVCGDLSDAEVIASKSALSPLTAILDGRSIEDHRKVINAKCTEINGELKTIPVRIDEVNRTMPSLTGLNEDRLKTDITKLNVENDDLEAKLIRIRNGGEVTVKQNQVQEVVGELLEIKNRFQSDSLDVITNKQTENYTIKSKISNIEHEINQKEKQVTRNNETIYYNNHHKGVLFSNWHEENQREFISSHPTDCAACGQSLPEDQVKAAHDKAEANFNETKSNNLEAINTKGKGLVAEIKQMEQDNITITADIDALKLTLQSLNDGSRVLINEIDKLQAARKDVELDPAYMAKLARKSKLEHEIKQLEVSVEQSIWDVKGLIAQVKDKKTALQQDLDKFETLQTSMNRIDELKEEEKALAAEYERLEGELFLTEEFIRVKVASLEKKINSKFELAKFKLFKVQVNGGLEEMCEATFDGVEYSKGLNSAARVNVGLDIINTLSRHYGFVAPIFIDNAESVTEIVKTAGQQIRLIVSKKDKKLRVEAETQQLAMEAI